MIEAIANGLLKSAESADDARHIVETAWDSRIAEAAQDLRVAWPSSGPPAPEDWPGYHITRVRIMRRALQSFSAAEHGAGWAQSRPQIERPLKDSAASLWGRPDRVEGPPGDRAVVDLKTGLAQASATTAQRRQLLLYAHLVAAQAGDLPKRIAIEDASGRRWEEPVDPGAVQAVIQEVGRARSEYESAATRGDFTVLAQPSPDNCRLCPYRPVCRPYWSSLDTSWQQGSVAGVIADAKVAPAGSVITVDAASPIDSRGQTWTVSAVHESGVVTGRGVTIVDAELTGAHRHLRCRWRTTMWLVSGNQPVGGRGTS
jgi:hypothetical protein